MLPRVNLIRANSADYLLFSTDDAISRAIYIRGQWCEPIATISSAFYSECSAPLILDIGANLGGYSIPIAQDIQKVNGEIYAFEPQRIIFYQLCGNILLNRLDNIHALHMALGDEEGSIDIPNIDYGLSQNIGGFSLDESIREKFSAVSINAKQNHEKVKMSTLDLLTLPRAVDLIKIDVEGFELRVLKGGTNLIETSNFPPLILEAWNLDWYRSQKTELMSFLKKLGYEYFEIESEVIAQHPNFHKHIDFVLQHDGSIQMVRSK